MAELQLEKNRGEIILRTEVREKILDYFQKDVGIALDDRDSCDFISRELRHSVSIISDKIMKKMDGDCNTLFCCECCVNFACGKIPVE